MEGKKNGKKRREKRKKKGEVNKMKERQMEGVGEEDRRGKKIE